MSKNYPVAAVEAALRLRSDFEGFERFVAYLEQRLLTQRVTNDTMGPDIQLRQGQGRAQECAEILELLTQAPRIHEELSRRAK